MAFNLSYMILFITILQNPFRVDREITMEVTEVTMETQITEARLIFDQEEEIAKKGVTKVEIQPKVPTAKPLAPKVQPKPKAPVPTPVPEVIPKKVVKPVKKPVPVSAPEKVKSPSPRLLLILEYLVNRLKII